MAATKMEKLCWVWNVIAVLFVKTVLPNFQKIYSILITLICHDFFFALILWNVKVTYFHEQYWLVLAVKSQVVFAIQISRPRLLKQFLI